MQLTVEPDAVPADLSAEASAKAEALREGRVPIGLVWLRTVQTR